MLSDKALIATGTSGNAGFRHFFTSELAEARGLSGDERKREDMRNRSKDEPVTACGCASEVLRA